MSAPLLQLNRISKSFGAVRALRDVSFDLRAGEVHALLGENGAGKSTLIKIITGAHEPDGGSIHIAGEELPSLTPAAAHRLGIACIYQQPALFPDLTVAENIGLRLEESSSGLHRVNWPERRRRAAGLLESIGAGISPETEVRQLSMPEQQLVEIACAIGAAARIVIMDEPTASLTHREQDLLFAVIRDLQTSGVGVIYISHRLEEIFAIANRVTVLRDGESVGTRELGNATAARPTHAELIRMMVGREVSQIHPAAESVAGEVVLSLQNVQSRAGGIDDATLEVRAGEIVGLAGLVGAGRTELARVLFGITPADAGEIRLHGERVEIVSPAAAVELGVAYVPEDRRRHGVILEMSLAANITLAIHRQIFPGAWLRLDAERRLAFDYMRRLDVQAPGPDAPAQSLSGGNQQKISLARWLATKPKALILDEPTQGVDVGAKSEIHKLIRQLAKEGMAVLLISSDLPEILGMSDRIAVMRGGAIVAMLPGGSSAHEVMEAALRAPKTEPHNGERVQTALTRLPISEERGAGKNLTGHFRQFTVGIVLGILLLLLAFAAPGFFQTQPLLSLLAREAPVLVVCAGMAFVIISRQIDISVGSQFAVCGVSAGLLATLHWPIAVMLVASIALGAALGALNGLLIAGLGLPSIVVTLATMVGWREALRWKRQGEFVNLPNGLQWLGLSQTQGQVALISIALLLLVLLALATKYLAAARFVYATGSDAEAARLAGLRPRRLTFFVFLLMGALTGLAALMNIVQSPQVDPKSGTGLELTAIAAVVVGGVAISGGRGNLWGVLPGLLLLACISPALTHLHAQPYWERAIQGAIILLAVVGEGAKRTRTQTSNPRINPKYAD
jgi:rhamnose transport system ATP-binding protein